MKKTIYFIMMTALIMSLLLIGCGNQGGVVQDSPTAAATSATTVSTTSEEKPSEEVSLFTEPGTFPIANEKIELRMFCAPPANIIDLTENDFTLWYEEKTNIHIIFETTTSDAVTEKVNLTMASGDMPDFFYRVTVDRERYGGEEGLLLDLTTLINEKMPIYKQVLIDYPMLEGAMKSTDGKIYGTGSLGGCYHCFHAQKMWVNTMWLEEMNEEVPTTTDEFYDLLKKYKDFNPDGVPLSGATDSWNTDPSDFVMNAFIYNNSASATRLYIKPGGIVSTIVDTDEYKEGLMYMNKLYKEGLLDEGALTQDTNSNKTLLASENEPVLFQPGGASVNWIDPTLQNELYSHYYPIAPLKGPQGVQLTTYFFPDIQVNAGIVVSANAKYPEAAVRWVDYMYSLEGCMNQTAGPNEGVDWRWPTDEDKALEGGRPAYNRLIPYTNEPQNHNWSDFNVGHSPWHSESTSPQDIDLFDPLGLETLLYKASKELYHQYIPTDGTSNMLPVTLKPDESSNIQTITTELTNLIKSSKAEFIMSIKSFDEWDNYVKSLNDIGLEEYLSTYQAAYDRQYK